tara:strand:+ start:391 stop:1095 length:705 start_codon:yes stop_codon:yes gene_type:complete
MIKIVYRISDVGFKKEKPNYISNEKCLANAIATFPLSTYKWVVLADGVSQETKEMIETHIPLENIEHINIKNGPGYPFMYILDKLLTTSNDEDKLYFIENDYIHKPGADVALLEGFELGADYITLYDHPDKYMDPSLGGNRYCSGGAEETRVYLSDSCHWKLTNSTTATFSTTIKTLKEDYNIIKKYANNVYWDDFSMFLELRDKKRTLISSIPGYSTHGEKTWLSPLTNWNKI